MREPNKSSAFLGHLSIFCRRLLMMSTALRFLAKTVAKLLRNDFSGALVGTEITSLAKTANPLPPLGYTTH